MPKRWVSTFLGITLVCFIWIDIGRHIVEEGTVTPTPIVCVETLLDGRGRKLVCSAVSSLV